MAPSAITSTAGSHADSGRVEHGLAALNGHQDGVLLSSSTTHVSNINTNQHTHNGHAPYSQDETLDLLCIGFGPASLAIAIALHDAQNPTLPSAAPKVMFLEKQPQFAWHAGMQLPGAKMQISFLKDLATPRDPRSKFTFLNYLFEKGRLNQFINLGTFLPTRVEYEDYMRWCAGQFEREGKVAYDMEVESVTPGERSNDGKVTSFTVTARNHHGEVVTKRARHIVIAVGGRPVIPQNLSGLKHVAHSSQFASTIGKIQESSAGRPLRFAVVGSGQSAAEIFNDLWERFPNSQIRLFIKGASLRPSDDSPFVNEIFDPDRVDGMYGRDPAERAAAIALDRGTNYGVVRLSLLEHLYEKLYMQRISNPDETQWRCRIIHNRAVISATQSVDSRVALKLGPPDTQQADEEWEVDYVFTATGYVRNAHEDILSETVELLPGDGRDIRVARDYRVMYDGEKVDERAGVWLQGCNEGTHGLSDTLLSIVAVRAGELVQSIFGDRIGSSSQA